MWSSCKHYPVDCIGFHGTSSLAGYGNDNYILEIYKLLQCSEIIKYDKNFLRNQPCKLFVYPVTVMVMARN
jgi:hypothetical protein